ncbi:MAG: hypothetical protein M1831_001734 [Alyxoria varia]|nr:MAG: hypothetical protein M1831_001734 [Alyxoria varia]
MTDLVPPSDRFSVKSGPAGKGVFALCEIPAQEQLFDTGIEKLTSGESTGGPVVHLILRQYRREVCAQCFAYDRGRAWPIRDHLITLGVAFCSVGCRNAWESQIDPREGTVLLETSVEYRARASYETFIRKHARVQKHRDDQSCIATEATSRQGDERDSVDEYGASLVDIISQSLMPKPSQIEDAWQKVDSSDARLIRAARLKDTPTKQERKALQNALQGMPGATDAASPPDADVLGYLLSGVLYAFRTRGNCRYSSASHHHTDIMPVPPDLISLVPDPQPYPSLISLYAHVAAYAYLLAIVPLELLPFTTSNLCHELASRASWNAFGLRPYVEGPRDADSGNSAESKTIDSGELLGWGVWPAASFFNHSCAPNMRKARGGRQWQFWAGPTSVEEGEELCISYLGGDEREMSVEQRRKKLREGWGFWCECAKCAAESALT